MELKIKDRDYVADGAGGLVRVSGWDELLERVLFKLSVRRGALRSRRSLAASCTFYGGKRARAARRQQSSMWPRRWRTKRA